MEWTITDSLERVHPEDWNRLAGPENPFIRHEFLVALERNACVGADSGWRPNHLLVHEAGRLVGAAPMYLKDHSYGEFVFDWAWAEAYMRIGLAYYPKLVVAVPFTPVPGSRLLVGPNTNAQRVAQVIIGGIVAHAKHEKVSSLHCLFTNPADTDRLAPNGFMRRTGCQFHWHNHGYEDFDEFLDGLTSKRRKQIKRERREVQRANLDVRIMSGHEISEGEWSAYNRLYRSTFDRKWGFPTLTLGFFKEVGRTMPESVVLTMVSSEGQEIAGALSFRGSNSLFGRHWGCSKFYHSLHFEACYYRAIDYCIRHGLKRFEAGAQGEHKISRGFSPVPTWSAHWIEHEGFREAVGKFLKSEEREMARYIAAANEHSPYKSAAAPGPLTDLMAAR